MRVQGTDYKVLSSSNKDVFYPLYFYIPDLVPISVQLVFYSVRMLKRYRGRQDALLVASTSQRSSVSSNSEGRPRKVLMDSSAAAAGMDTEPMRQSLLDPASKAAKTSSAGGKFGNSGKKPYFHTSRPSDFEDSENEKGTELVPSLDEAGSLETALAAHGGLDMLDGTHSMRGGQSPNLGNSLE